MITEVVKQKGLEHITVDDLVAEITPKGRGQYLIKQSSTSDTCTCTTKQESISVCPFIPQASDVITNISFYKKLLQEFSILL